MKNNEIPKIAFLLGSTSSNGGIERVASIIADQLIIQNIAEVHALGFHPRVNKQVYKWNKNVVFLDLLAEKKSMKDGLIAAVPKLRNHLRMNKIDILISCGHIYTLLGFLGTVALRSKFVYWSHSSLISNEVSRYKKVNEHIGALFSKLLITLTKTDETNYKRLTLANNVVQIYNPIDEELSNSDVPYNLNSKKIISVGRLNPQKRFESNLLQVASIVLKKNPEWTWHIYGKGELEPLIKKRIASFDLLDRVILKGNVTNLYDLYSDYSMMVMTSAYEGFPMSLLEGLEKKLPLVSFDIPTGPNEIIEDNFNGFLIPAFDCYQMADKINNLINDKNLRIQFSDNSRRVKDSFQINSIINQWKMVIKSLVKSV